MIHALVKFTTVINILVAVDAYSHGQVEEANFIMCITLNVLTSYAYLLHKSIIS